MNLPDLLGNLDREDSKFERICLIAGKTSQHRVKIIHEPVDRIDGLTLKFLFTTASEISAVEQY